MENSIEVQVSNLVITDSRASKNERVSSFREPLNEIGNSEVFSTVEQSPLQTDLTKNEDSSNKKSTEEVKENMTNDETSCNDFHQVIEIIPPMHIPTDEPLTNYCVTPPGCNTYKGVPTSKIIEDLHSKKPEKTSKKQVQPPIKKQRISKNHMSKKVVEAKMNEGKNANGSSNPNPKKDDKSSFTLKLQQFLSTSMNIFSPQAKAKSSIVDLESTSTLDDKAGTSYSTKAKKCLNPEEPRRKPDAAENELVTEKTEELAVEANVEKPEAKEAITAEQAGSKAVETEPKVDQLETKIVDQKTESKLAGLEPATSESNKSTLGAIKDFLKTASPKRVPSAKKVNRSKPGSSRLVSKQGTVVSQTGTSAGVNNQTSTKTYSRRDLMQLSNLPACNKVPDFSGCQEDSVKKDLDCGSAVRSRYLPINIVSRDFKLKYRL